MQQPLVEGLEVVGPEPAQPDPKRGDDVPFDVASVAGVGAGREHDALAGQPAPREEGAEGQRPPLVVASVALGGEPPRELLGDTPFRARGVPAPSFSASDMVDALVHDRVPAVSLADDVSREWSRCGRGIRRSGKSGGLRGRGIP
jgi:hypothetical protein